MQYITAVEEHAEQIFNLVQETIREVYPKYYPKEVVDFFCRLHSRENIMQDIQNGNVIALTERNTVIGTGSCKDNHITRVYVLPEYQGKGYGSFIMQKLEDTIASKYNVINIDASLPASIMYEHRGYKAIKHGKCECENGVMLVYEIMEKSVGNEGQ